MYLIDANVLIDIAAEDPVWADWSANALIKAADTGPACINPVIFAELAAGYASPEDLDAGLDPHRLERLELPYAAAFLAGRAFQAYRRRGGARTHVLPDFLIGAHAAVEGLTLVTRDPRPYRTYFPTVDLISPT